MSKKVIKIIIIALSVILALIVAAVVLMWYFTAPLSPSDSPTGGSEQNSGLDSEIVEVRSIRIVLDNYEMLVGSRFWPEVVIVPENATDLSFELRSDNERILRQQGNNWVAVGVGRVNLVATASNGITGRVMVTVLAPDLLSMSFAEDEIIMSVGDITALNPMLTPSDARLDEPITYSSNDEDVVTVTNDGRVEAVNAGNAIITASSGDIRAEIKISVGIPVRSINVILDRYVFSVGEEADFTIETDPPDATNVSVSVSFSGANVTSTGEYSLKFDEPGEVTITASAENVRTVSRRITVVDLNVLAGEVFRLTNVERTRAELTELGRTQPLNQVALVRAKETIEYFSHTRPDGREFYTVYTDNGIEYRVAGENLASGQRTPVEVVQAWMDSPGHRENILNRDFGNIGIGVTIDDDGTLFWTQMFMN